MTCKSRTSGPYPPGWECDGSDKLAYEVGMGGNKWQAVAIPPDLADEWLAYGWVRKIKQLPRDHWHARRRETA